MAFLLLDLLQDKILTEASQPGLCQAFLPVEDVSTVYERYSPLPAQPRYLLVVTMPGGLSFPTLLHWE